MKKKKKSQFSCERIFYEILENISLRIKFLIFFIAFQIVGSNITSKSGTGKLTNGVPSKLRSRVNLKMESQKYRALLIDTSIKRME